MNHVDLYGVIIFIHLPGWVATIITHAIVCKGKPCRTPRPYSFPGLRWAQHAFVVIKKPKKVSFAPQLPRVDFCIVFDLKMGGPRCWVGGWSPTFAREESKSCPSFDVMSPKKYKPVRGPQNLSKKGSEHLLFGANSWSTLRRSGIWHGFSLKRSARDSQRKLFPNLWFGLTVTSLEWWFLYDVIVELSQNVLTHFKLVN